MAEVKSQSMALQWTGRILTGLTILFMLFDAFGKFAKPIQVTDAFTRLGLPLSTSTTIGILLLVSTIVYAIPRTAVLGAVLLTGFLGGAVAIHLRAGSTTFEQVFPVIFGIVAWAGVYLRECGLRRVFPVRR
ncbi:MAG: DoxX family protein [Acidobacteria bacterium]|nr:DoxX family protein [Acidobacteriota bacterium]